MRSIHSHNPLLQRETTLAMFVLCALDKLTDCKFSSSFSVYSLLSCGPRFHVPYFRPLPTPFLSPPPPPSFFRFVRSLAIYIEKAQRNKSAMQHKINEIRSTLSHSCNQSADFPTDNDLRIQQSKREHPKQVEYFTIIRSAASNFRLGSLFCSFHSTNCTRMLCECELLILFECMALCLFSRFEN